MSNWNKASIHALLDANQKAVQRAIVAIYNAQTNDEQSSGRTKDHNGVGFGAYDAEFMSSLAVQIKAGKWLTGPQFAIGRNKIKRYWRQLAEIANAKEARREAVESVATPAVPEYEAEFS